MDSLPASGAKPPSGRKVKARAPPPPGKPFTTPNIHGDQKPNRDLGIMPQQNLVNMKENLKSSMVDVTVVLPNGLEIKSAINGRTQNSGTESECYTRETVGRLSKTYFSFSKVIKKKAWMTSSPKIS